MKSDKSLLAKVQGFPKLRENHFGSSIIGCVKSKGNFLPLTQAYSRQTTPHTAAFYAKSLAHQLVLAGKQRLLSIKVIYRWPKELRTNITAMYVKFKKFNNEQQ